MPAWRASYLEPASIERTAVSKEKAGADADCCDSRHGDWTIGGRIRTSHYAPWCSSYAYASIMLITTLPEIGKRKAMMSSTSRQVTHSFIESQFALYRGRKKSPWRLGVHPRCTYSFLIRKPNKRWSSSILDSVAFGFRVNVPPACATSRPRVYLMIGLVTWFSIPTERD